MCETERESVTGRDARGRHTMEDRGPTRVKQPQVSMWLTRLGAREEQLSKVVTELEDRLAGVLRDQPPSPEEKACEERPAASCGLAKRLVELDEGLRMQGARLQRMIELLEV